MHSHALDSLPSGTTVGRYRIVRRLAIGGMAELFLATAFGPEGFARRTVLKRILPQYAGDGRFLRMFLREARLAATLQHPNIAQVYDIEKHDGTYFIAMEYVHGVDLQQLMSAVRERGRRIGYEQAIAIVAGVAAGLHHAHEHRSPEGDPLGIVHRDVSPSNILVDRAGCVKVVDFGIAKGTFESGETRPGSMRGKLAYMAPEQLDGRTVDRRADIFALGEVLYELTTGNRLFEGNTEAIIYKRILTHDERELGPFGREREDYPPELEAIVRRAIARRPEDRYPTARDLQLALEELARANKWNMSSMMLAALVTEMFGDELDLSALAMQAQPPRAGVQARSRCRRWSLQAPTQRAPRRYPRPRWSARALRAHIHGRG
jgi:eukaryotic-like serine/threonine-protein kinase